ncbi:hypothetical protein ACP26L_13305 [Paenibacillus sp. S-38]|uniref:hypothetical protein n=1 Tax=Paenibacillus sp. S-38 TaxID=3416710 RepID=UPI003CF5EDC9
MALVHDFILISQNDYNALLHSTEILKYRDRHPANVAVMSDGMFAYMQDSLSWIETHNPSKNVREYGFNRYGQSMVERRGAEKFLRLMEAWFLIFSEAPDQVILTGEYTWDGAEAPIESGYYEPLTFQREEMLDCLGRLISFAKKVQEEDYIIIQCGI